MRLVPFHGGARFSKDHRIYRITELFWSEETFEIMESNSSPCSTKSPLNHAPLTALNTRGWYLCVPHLLAAHGDTEGMTFAANSALNGNNGGS